MAALAARVVGLDIAGIDLVCEDISRPLDEQRGAIIEVNASPGLLAHIKPATGKPRPVGKAIVEHLFADAETGRIPLVGVTGTMGQPGRAPGRLPAVPHRQACGRGQPRGPVPRRPPGHGATAPASTPASAC
jgi:hypothetical protein